MRKTLDLRSSLVNCGSIKPRPLAYVGNTNVTRGVNTAPKQVSKVNAIIARRAMTSH